MPLPSDTLDAIANARDPSRGPLIVPWPLPGNLAGAVRFSTFAEWRSFILALSLGRAVPEIVASKFERAQKLYFLAWVDFDLIKAGELVALTALELALADCYAGKESGRRRELVAAKAEKEKRPIAKSELWWIGYTSFADLLKFMVERDGLTADQIAMNWRCGPASELISRLTGEMRPSLTDIRNDLAHGATSDGFPSAGLLELARDLIDYAYRDRALSWNDAPKSPLDIGAESASRTVRETGQMLAGLNPRLDSDEFVFCATNDADAIAKAQAFAIGWFREGEGTSLVLEMGRAEALGFEVNLPMRRIVLTVNSALDGVGLTAAVSQALAANDIPCNVVAAYRHDHLFVPSGMAERALTILKDLQANAG